MTTQITVTEREHEVFLRLTAWLVTEHKDKFTADDLYRLQLVPLLPEPHRKTVGSWFRKMQHISLIRKTGLMIPSSRSTNHGRLLPVWELMQVID